MINDPPAKQNISDQGVIFMDHRLSSLSLGPAYYQKNEPHCRHPPMLHILNCYGFVFLAENAPKISKKVVELGQKFFKKGPKSTNREH